MFAHSSRRWPFLALITLCAIASHSASAQNCALEYRRADNMWAAFGRPDGNLGVENIAVGKGSARAFATDWRYEKTRNDGTNYYGSHLRVAVNRGTIPVRVSITSALLSFKAMLGNNLASTVQQKQNTGYVELQPGETRLFQADLMEVRCP